MDPYYKEAGAEKRSTLWQRYLENERHKTCVKFSELAAMTAKERSDMNPFRLYLKKRDGKRTRKLWRLCGDMKRETISTGHFHLEMML